MAAVGRGVAHCVLLNDRPEETIDAFTRRMDKPVLTDVSVKFDGADVHSVLPAAAPDVFAGMPVYIHGRYEKPWEGAVEVLGRIGTQARSTKLQVTLPGPAEEHSPLPSIWARQQIKELETEQLRGGVQVGGVEQRITQLALEYSLMSAYTSFVAVDETPSVSGGGPPEFVPVSVPMPEGVQYDKTINERANLRAKGGGWGGGQPGSGPSGGGRSGGGPIGPFGVLGVAGLALIEWRRRRRNASCA
jgi:Ca-activated chloride channel homolog